ncbi:MAG: hypothetical protein Q8O58_03260, partial [Gallionella sp.]|nr:hypothetical protein [Gallionella sp.]
KQIAEAELARDTAMARAENMAKLRAEEARKAAERVQAEQRQAAVAQAEQAMQVRIGVEPAACVTRSPRMTEMLGITALP